MPVSIPPATCLVSFRGAPDAIKCVLQFSKHRCRANEQKNESDHGGRDAFGGFVDAGKNVFDRLRSVGAHQPA